MYRRDDPRLRRTLDQLSHNVETATEHAQENLYTFSQNYITPCFSSIGNCFRSCTPSCFPVEESRRRRQRGRSRGLAESSFDFYDDWDDEENDAMAWTNSSDELDRLLADPQPGRERAMSYGARRADGRAGRKNIAPPGPDPNVIKASHYIGFLDQIPFVGRKGLRYKPSAAGLQEHPGARRDVAAAIEEEPLIDDSEEEVDVHQKRAHKRNRSETVTSGHTTSSLSSRGDLFPSEDEADAIPLDDEFDIALERRTTDSGGDGDSRRSRPGKSKSSPRLSNRTMSSKSMRRTSGLRAAELSSPEVTTLKDLKLEEDRVRMEEERAVEKKREAATRLALQRGLSSGGESKSETPASTLDPSAEHTTFLEEVGFASKDPAKSRRSLSNPTSSASKSPHPNESLPLPLPPSGDGTER